MKRISKPNPKPSITLDFESSIELGFEMVLREKMLFLFLFIY